MSKKPLVLVSAANKDGCISKKWISPESTSASTSRGRGGSAREWRKNWQPKSEVQREYPDATVEIWAEDEHRLGLHPVTRRVWVEAGGNPHRYSPATERMVVAVCLRTTRNGRHLLVDSALRQHPLTKVLQDFSTHFGIGEKKASHPPLAERGWHLKRQTRDTRRNSLITATPILRSYTSRTIMLVNEPLASKAFGSIEAVEDIVESRCRELPQQQHLIQGLTSYR